MGGMSGPLKVVWESDSKLQILAAAVFTELLFYRVLLWQDGMFENQII